MRGPPPPNNGKQAATPIGKQAVPSKCIVYNRLNNEKIKTFSFRFNSSNFNTN